MPIKTYLHRKHNLERDEGGGLITATEGKERECKRHYGKSLRIEKAGMEVKGHKTYKEEAEEKKNQKSQNQKSK